MLKGQLPDANDERLTMTALALALHVLGAVVWVGGMFAAYMCLRPAAGPLDPPVRLKLWSAFFQKFFPVRLDRDPAVARERLLDGVHDLRRLRPPRPAHQPDAGPRLGDDRAFLWLFHGPWLKLKRAVAASDWPTAGANLNRIRQIIAVNLPLGLLVVIIGASGRYWG